MMEQGLWALAGLLAFDLAWVAVLWKARSRVA
jgi:hypothetical protein